MLKSLVTATASLLCAMTIAQAQTPLHDTHLTRSDLPVEEGFVARSGSVSLLLNVIAGKMQQSAIVSAKAQKKRLEGKFDMADPAQTLDAVCKELALIWYSDGQSLYVYDAQEMRSALGHIRHGSVQSLKNFLRQSNLEDRRYPVRSGAEGTFYVSGPPIYVELVLNAAKYIDAVQEGVDARTTHVEVIKLANSFVGGRPYSIRGEKSLLPGIADVVMEMLGKPTSSNVVVSTPQPAAESNSDPAGAPAANLVSPLSSNDAAPQATQLAIVAHPQSNSLIVRGTREQIQQARRLVAAIDVARRQVELSLWIIDVKKSEVDQLGVNWSGHVKVNKHLGISLNQDQGSFAALDSTRFLAAVSALVKTGAASVVSRPVVVTQENVEAHFDSNQTFYEPLVGERVTSLESVTYGTLVSVLPRLSADGEIEMQLRIEDGNASASTSTTGLPVIARTSIDTLARVPAHLSLLIGGYTRSTRQDGVDRIPGLSRAPGIGGLFRTRRNTSESIVRVFLIQPRVLDSLDNLTKERVKQRLPEPASDRIDEVSALLPRAAEGKSTSEQEKKDGGTY